MRQQYSWDRPFDRTTPCPRCHGYGYLKIMDPQTRRLMAGIRGWCEAFFDEMVEEFLRVYAIPPEYAGCVTGYIRKANGMPMYFSTSDRIFQTVDARLRKRWEGSHK